MVGEDRDAIRLTGDVGNSIARRAQRLAGEFRDLCEAIFAVERGPYGAAHQAAAGERDQDGRCQPTNGYATAIDRLLDVTVETERGFVSQFDCRCGT